VLTTPGDFRVNARLTDAAGASSISAALMLRVLAVPETSSCVLALLAFGIVVAARGRAES
jgi:hypothetical protein